MADGWQPIETAPKDGSVFIALSPHGISRCTWENVHEGGHPLDPVIYWWSDPDCNIYFEDGPFDEPTHWMPLPPPPTEERA